MVTSISTCCAISSSPIARIATTGISGFVPVDLGPLADEGGGQGMDWGDYDNDGHLDLYVVNGTTANKLYRNLGGGTFVDVTTPPLDHGFFDQGAAWVDYDRDGRLDLFLTAHTPSNRLFRNLGGGSFLDVTPPALSIPFECGASAWGDYDGDGDSDAFICVQDGEDVLARNDGFGAFTNVTAPPMNDPGFGQGAAWGDYDNDTDFDLFVCNLGQENRLYRNDAGVFVDVATGDLAGAGPNQSGTWSDFDNDRDLDLVVTRLGDTIQLFRNDAGAFQRLQIGFPSAPTNSVGAAWGDFDRDGDEDLLVPSYEAPDRLYRNGYPHVNHWLEITLEGTASNRSAIGARIMAIDFSSGVSQIREHGSNRGYWSCNAPAEHFGLGSSTSVDLLVIRWPSGTIESYFEIPADRGLHIVEGGGVVGTPEVAAGVSRVSARPNPFRDATEVVWAGGTRGIAELSIFDVGGRMVRSLRGEIPGSIRWDGANRRRTIDSERCLLLPSSGRLRDPDREAHSDAVTRRSRCSRRGFGFRPALDHSDAPPLASRAAFPDAGGGPLPFACTASPPRMWTISSLDRSSADLAFMRRALELSERARGRTAPNPIVGAVVVSPAGKIVGEGFHARAGEPHAEVVALGAAGKAARGATLFVTLEPCSHYGRTPPCVDAIREAGVARVVFATGDPDPRVAGLGQQRLREAGIAVESGLLALEAMESNAEYLFRVARGRVFAAIKAAVTLDGRLAADGGDARWITGEPARRRAHELRDRYDAVLVGRATVEQDDPQLNVRLPSGGRDPVVVVADSRLASPLERRLWDRARGGATVVVACLEGAPPERADRLSAQGVTILPSPADSQGRVDLAFVFEALASRGLNSVLVEGGEEIITSVLRADLAQRAHVFIAPAIVGGASGPRLAGDLGIRRIADAIRLRAPKVEILGDDMFVTGAIGTPESMDADGATEVTQGIAETGLRGKESDVHRDRS